MRLLSARIRNYRTHLDSSVSFAGNPTLIAGANESGKSTLIEAIHCGLFLKASTGGQIRKAMESDHGGNPEVEIAFETGHGRFTVRKRFSRNTGTTTLEEAGHPAISGGEAEDRLAEVLGVDGSISGGGAEAKLDKRWAHLWVKQGRSGSDPSGEFQDHHDDLVSRLQSLNGAGAVQSDLDRRIHSRLRERLSEFLTDNGKPRAGSPLQQVQEQLTQLREKETAAQAALERLESAIRQLEAADGIISEKTPQLETNEERLRGIRATQEQVRELQASLQPLANQLQQLGSESATIQQQTKQIGEISARLPKLRQSAEAARKTLAESAEAALKAGEESGRYDDALEKTRGDLDQARQFRESCRLLKDCLRLRILLADLEKQSKLLEAREAELQEKQTALASLPQITAAKLGKVRDLHQKRIEAEAALNALATSVDVLAGDAALRIDGHPAGPGTRQSYAGAFEIKAGEGVHLRITPGGGESLVEAQEAFEKAGAALREILAQVEAESLSAAENHLASRTALEAEIRAIKRGIEQAGGDEFRNRLARAGQDLTAAEAKWSRSDQKNLPEAATEDTAQEAFDSAEKACGALEVELARLTELRSQAATRLTQANQGLAQAQAVCEQAAKSLRDTEVQLRTLEETHGSASQRQTRTEEIARQSKDLQAQKDAIDLKLRELGADQIDTKSEMLTKSVGQLRDQIQQARVDKGAASARLDEAGTGDPAGDLEEIREQLRALEARQTSEQTRVSALQLLVNRFEEQVAALEKRFTQPLLEKVSGYLSIVFGPQARATARYQDGAFQDLALDRSAQGLGTHSFGSLSGGAKEQLGVAFRLAVAEIVAEAHDGCLPLVLDDAFVNSDAERVNGLLLMIYRAAGNGLQILLCTCNPADYTELGANEIRLAKPAPRFSPVPNIPANEEPEVESLPPESNSSPVEITAAHKDQFLEALQGAGGRLGNGALREQLGWAPPTYEAVKNSLLESGQIQKGQGRGGSVILQNGAQ